jgi:putative ABC transport system ATP-binding protein
MISGGTMSAFFSLRGIRKEYPLGRTSVTALDGIDLDLEPGLFYSIVGPSGCGKSSLWHILGFMDAPSGGEMRFRERRVDRFTETERTGLRAAEIGFVFRFFHLNPILTARENVAIALRFLGADQPTAFRRAAEQLEKVGMALRRNHFPAELSGGERQRAAIARAVVKHPSLLLADEPTGNLDSRKGCEIMALLRGACRMEGSTVVQATHNREMAEQSDRITALRDGRTVRGSNSGGGGNGDSRTDAPMEWRRARGESFPGTGSGGRAQTEARRSAEGFPRNLRASVCGFPSGMAIPQNRKTFPVKMPGILTCRKKYFIINERLFISAG